MGNRDDLLAGAKHCLYQQGYAQPTSRDIASAAGVSMGAIAYHFGSREALLNEALIQATEEWGAELDAAVAAPAPALESTADRFERIWSRMIESLESHRGLWAATLEAYTHRDQAPAVREQLRVALARARVGLARVIHPAGLSDDAAWRVGSVYQALLTGLALQWLIDPERAVSGGDLAEAVRVMAAAIEGPEPQRPS